MVPMHLGRIEGPFAPHNLISTQDRPVPLLKLQTAPRLKILMSFGSKERTQIYFIFSLKNPGKRPPSRFSNRAPMERDTRLLGILHIFQNLTKIPLTKKVVRKKRPSKFPKSGAPMEVDAHFRALLNISFGVPSKGALPQGPLHGIPRREMPRIQSTPSFIFQSPRYMSSPPDSRFPSFVKRLLRREMPVFGLS